jgi:hypothetical protein
VHPTRNSHPSFRPSSAQGGPKGLEATFDGTKLTFPDGNHWSLVPIPSSKVVAIDGPPTDELQGVFHDHGHYEEGTWKGVRMVTNATGVDSGSKVTLVGSDDGKAFWTLKGDAAGGGTKVSIDFSPKGGPKGLEASWDGAKLTFPDGNHWARVPGAPATGIASYVWAALASVAVVGLGLFLKK